MNDQAIAIRPSPATFMAPAPITPMEMLNQAVERGADIEVLTKLMDLQERWEANQARKAFDEAIANAKAEIGPVIRNTTGHNGKYADFAAIARTVDPHISKEGLSYRFRSDQTEKTLTVTCILRHKAGHSEETTLTGPIDASGNKTPIQGIGSSATYLQRYTLVLALGLAAAHDDDGNAARGAAADATGECLSDDQLVKIRARLKQIAESEDRFLKYLKVERLEDVWASKFGEIMKILDMKDSGK